MANITKNPQSPGGAKSIPPRDAGIQDAKIISETFDKIPDKKTSSGDERWYKNWKSSAKEWYGKWKSGADGWDAQNATRMDQANKRLFLKKPVTQTTGTAPAPQKYPAVPIDDDAAQKNEKERSKLLKKQEKEEDLMIKQLRDAGKVISGKGTSVIGSGQGTISMLLWLVLITAIVDYFTGDIRPGFMYAGYLLIALYIMLFMRNNMSASDMGVLMTVIVIAYLLPFGVPLLQKYAMSDVGQMFAGMLLWFPVLPLYLMFKYPENRTSKILTIVVIIAAFLLLLNVVTSYISTQNNVKLLANPMASAKYVSDIMLKGVTDTTKSISVAINQAIAQATGQPYEGTEESQVGIFVTDVKPLESKYNTNSRVFVEAKIAAKNVKEPMNVNILCYIEGVKQGNVSPSLISQISGNDENIIDCNLGKLKEGSYTAKVRADFEFETTSDITYTFVSPAVRSDQYTQLGIEETTIATYTGGPVALGLPSLHQPLRLDISEGNIQLSSYPFGVSLENKWPQGKVVRGLMYVLDVPDEVKLEDCSRTPEYTRTMQQDEKTYRNIYVFKIDTANAQDVFDAVTCRMKFDDVKTLLGNDFKSVKTFAARATYEYAVEGTTGVYVEKYQ
jgi:hypothetical protein